ncbi:hypothetical protein NQ317_019820 [Molorchus minor]|uniref:Uncharacterized protein n=1 Tax=Molorchus minor TaxID=1323400 RepID=A0ABQ9JEH8_9CUCU|nr:hypothetical protein NQ317_019820 [Molorchus minor]
MALCDHRYKFKLVDIGARGRQSDGGIFRNSEMGRKLMNNELNLSSDSPIEYGGDNIPFYMNGNNIRHVIKIEDEYFEKIISHDEDGLIHILIKDTKEDNEDINLEATDVKSYASRDNYPSWFLLDKL